MAPIQPMLPVNVLGILDHENMLCYVDASGMVSRDIYFHFAFDSFRSVLEIGMTFSLFKTPTSAAAI